MRSTLLAAISATLLLGAVTPLKAGENFVVRPQSVTDEKAVFATVESANVVAARARIGGTVAALMVRRGDPVVAGQAIARVVDDKIALQIRALDAQIDGLRAQLAQARNDLSRAERLAPGGAVSQAQLDTARTLVQVAERALETRIAERSVVVQQQSEGEVVAPAAGRILDVPVTLGTVVMTGEAIAQVADRDYKLRLRLPERHARFLKAGDPVRLGGAELGTQEATTGRVALVYPRIEDGRVVADARVEGLGDYFVGERIRVFVSAGERTAIVIPAGYVATRFGIDYVRLKTAEGTADVPIQPGQPMPRPDMADGIEVLSGLKAGDVLVRP